MTDNYVSREEFDNLKNEVKEIKIEMAESSRLLQAIDKKIDVINEKIVTADKIDDLRLTPLEKRVSTLEESQTWIRRTVLGQIIAIIIAAIVFVLKMQ